MSAKTMFYAFAVFALAAVWSAAALPLVVDEVTSPANLKENLDTEVPSAEVQKHEPEQQTQGTDASVLETDGIESSPNVQQSSQTEEVTVGSEIPVIGIDSGLPEVSNVKSDSDVSTITTAVQTEGITGTNSPSPVAETNSPSPVAGMVPSSADTKPSPSVPVNGQPPKPYYTGGVQTVKIGPSIPFFLELIQPFQPFQSFQPFQPFHPYGSNNDKPFRNQPIPFGAPIDPFANPMNTQPFNQMVEAYTNEFRTPQVVILKPKRNVRLNTTAMPPIPLLMNIMLNAFRHHEPSDMLASFDKMGMPPMENFGDAQEGSAKPVTKTTSKTEIIDGHRVQINETTVTNGDGNHKSFYHFKEIQVLPEGMNKKISNEKLISISNDDLETEKVETNEIKPNPSVSMEANVNDDRKNFIKKAPGPVSLDDHFQTAAASYYAPYAPLYGQRQPPAGLLQQKQYHGSYPIPNQAFYPGPNQGFYPAPNQGFYPAQNQGFYPAHNQGFYPAQNQGFYPAQNQGSHPAQNQGFYPAQNQGSHPAQNQGSRPSHPRPDQETRPTQAPISLHGDTLVNEIAAAQQQSSGGVVLPPDVEFVDVNGKPQPSGQYHHYNSNKIINDNGRRGHDNFPGRKY
ncbi:uncharacterized protein LOC132917877 isoform X1 [Rhopalosiphum padi]|uniref:uncharacterized protein LOC132917877 isoform X1 n=1 Tax=Rhopalosiphum padi TaxID=40932 RepID=UPI00298DEEA6|nr:uncharacterized protein LOC132917877 isoform X1 [Rhopalosiphum padi]